MYEEFPTNVETNSDYFTCIACWVFKEIGILLLGKTASSVDRPCKRQLLL